MDPRVWGSNAWIFLHSITMAYPDNPTIYDQQNYNNFFTNLADVLPCSVCVENYKIHLKLYPITNVLDSKKKLTRWLFDIHNKVNKEKGLPDFSYDDFKQKYSELYGEQEIQFGGDESIYNKYKYYILLIILFIIFSYRNEIYKFLFNRRY